MNYYRLPATLGRPEVGLALLDKLDCTLGRRPARKKATGQSTETVLQGSCGEYLLNAPLIVIQNDADVTEAKAITAADGVAAFVL